MNTHAVSPARIARWNRLQANLEEAGITAKVSRFQESLSITVKTPRGELVEVRDGYTRRDSWAGWQVWLENPRSGLSRDFRAGMKNRADVVATVEALLVK